ncbi:MAG: alpha-galactosidase [Clostridia bacterium]|nr:alpha-galactosidase [Clostridia bacterium]
MKKLVQAGWELSVEGFVETESETKSWKLYSVNSFHDDHGILERRDYFENKSPKILNIRRILSVFEISGRPTRILYQKSAWCRENKTTDCPAKTPLFISSRGARTTADFNPFVIIETDEGQCAFHLMPVGDWEIGVNSTPDGIIRISMGLSSENLNLKVSPFQMITLPAILVHNSSSKDEYENAESLHGYLNSRHFRHRGRIPVPYNSWFFDFDKFTSKDLREQADRAFELGMEAFIVDAGWYGPSNDDWARAAGDWREKTSGAFLGRMKDFSDYIISKGMRFGLWIEPERFCAGVPALFENPGFFIEAGEGNHYPRLDDPKAAGFIYLTISRLITEYNVGWLKLDFNFSLGGDPSGSNFYYYIKGLHSLMDRLRADFPNVILEGCESGAMRFGHETAKRYDVHFLSDNVNPADALGIFKGALLRMPPSIIYKWIVLREIAGIPQYGRPLTEAPGRLITPRGATWESFESFDISFMCCLAVSGHPGFSGDLRGLSKENSEILRKYIGFYKEYGDFISNCSAYLYGGNGGDCDPGWVSYRFESPGRDENLLFCFRLSSEKPIFSLKLKGLDESRDYSIRDVFGVERTITGRAIAEGLPVRVEKNFSALLLIVKPA